MSGFYRPASALPQLGLIPSIFSLYLSPFLAEWRLYSFCIARSLPRAMHE